MFDRIVIVTKPTRLEELRRRWTDDLIAFDLERKGSSIEDYRTEHDTYYRAMQVVRRSLPSTIPVAELSRDVIATSDSVFRKNDLIIAVGPDGLFVNLAKYTTGQPILTVNPDSERIDGVLMKWEPKEVAGVVHAMFKDDFEVERVTLAKAETNDGQVLYAVNDFLVGRLDHVSARYSIKYGVRTERQSSSGVLISTGCGSSGWMKSVACGAEAVASGSSHEKIPFNRTERYLLFAVREPFPSHATGTSIIFGKIRSQSRFKLTSEMSEGGVIFSDGVTEHALEWSAGTTVTISVASEVAVLVTEVNQKSTKDHLLAG